MEPKFQTSFIPKKPLVSTQSTSVSVVRTTNIFSLIASTLFIVVLLVSGGLFFYKIILNKQIVADDQAVNDARSAFQPDTIQNLIDTNSKIMAISNLLDHHVAVSGLLTFLQQNTLTKVRLDDFKYKSGGSNPPTFEVKVEAQSYNALATQGDVFTQSGFIKNSYFSGYAPEQNGFIRADFSGAIDPSLVSYKKIVGGDTGNNSPSQTVQGAQTNP